MSAMDYLLSSTVMRAVVEAIYKDSLHLMAWTSFPIPLIPPSTSSRSGSMSRARSHSFLPSGKGDLRNRHKDTPKFPLLCESPFKRAESEESDAGDEEKDESISGYDFDGFQTFPTRKIWSDLLLDISMTTTFNSLTNGTEVLDAETCVSYLFFFTLVWWIWASQVCYDVRFTKADWVHRLSVFLQFIIFCALAAFTKDFDIGYKLSSSASAEEKVVDEIQTLGGSSEEQISAAQFRENRLPILNARGISLVMMFSRVLLLVQYLLTLYHAPADSSRDSPLTRMWVALTGPGFRAFQTHILSLTLSATSYLISFIILESSVGQSEGAQIAKIILWYLPVVWEIGAHFLALKQRGHVQYPLDSVYERSAASFIIILGGGLDNITEGFQLIVGNVTIGTSGTGLVLAGAISFITQFSLYFEMTKGHTITRRKFGYCRRVLAWFIAHFLYFASLIIMLQAIAALLKFGNIGKALNLPLQFLAEANGAIEDAGDGNSISSDAFSTADQIKALGLNLDDLLSFINNGVQLGLESNSSVLDPDDSDIFGTPALQVAHNAALQASAILISVILDNFELTPDPNSLLGSELDVFLDVDANDTTSLSNTFDDVWYDIAERAFTNEAIPALWLYGSAGLTLISLSGLGLIKWWGNLDSYRRAVLSIRLAVGIITCLLSFIDINQGNQFLDTIDKNSTKFSFTLSGAVVWTLASHSLLIPIFSILIFCEQLAEFIIIFVLQKRAKPHISELAIANIDNISTVASLGLVRRPVTYDPYRENAQSTASITLAERGYLVDHGNS